MIFGTNLWKHPECSTVTFEVLSSFYVRNKGIYKLHVYWYNIGRCHSPWYMGIDQKLEIPKTKMMEFRKYEYKPEDIHFGSITSLCIRDGILHREITNQARYPDPIPGSSNGEAG